VVEESPYAQAHQAIGEYFCAFSALERELGEVLKVVLRLQGNAAADAIVALIRDFVRKALVVGEAIQTATKADGAATTPQWKAQADKTLADVLGCNNDRRDLAHDYLEAFPAGSITLQKPGQPSRSWSYENINSKIAKMGKLTSELTGIRTDLTTLNVPIPTGWMSVDTFQPRQISQQLWDALTSQTSQPIPPSP
jgi:hypothetical protein